ncbi:MAG: hypothetical protein J2P48_12740 [Alphaproteobacteria bacterium]|nr:hypothetical protein [Alphaproteobacteria bacterium]
MTAAAGSFSAFMSLGEALVIISGGVEVLGHVQEIAQHHNDRRGGI